MHEMYNKIFEGFGVENAFGDYKPTKKPQEDVKGEISVHSLDEELSVSNSKEGILIGRKRLADQIDFPDV